MEPISLQYVPLRSQSLVSFFKMGFCHTDQIDFKLMTEAKDVYLHGNKPSEISIKIVNCHPDTEQI